MPPIASTSTTKRPAPGTGAGRPPAGAARPGGPGAGRPARPATAGPSRPRIPVRGAAGASGRGNTKPVVDVKPEVNLGEEEWSKLMKETYGGKQSAEWYAKGAKSVEVGLASRSSQCSV